jgi:hypothetical protein
MTNQATNQQTGEGSQATIDLEKYVPKDEYNKLNQEVEGLKRTLEDEKLKLLDPGYIEYLESKRNKKVTQADVDKVKASGAPQEVVNLIEELKGRVVRTESLLANMSAIIELQEVEKEFPDFGEYREEVKKILEGDTAGMLSFKQAYFQAKGMGGKQSSSTATSNAASGDKVIKGNEKPGQYVPPSNTQKNFNSPYEAGQDAINQVKTKYNIVGDII